ncbi:glycerophosphodiester phosphodiesterase family protein [Thalassolituus maritimus]|uniref:Glycerophosphodiester phosphodiesterase n=1 Tax=Thalassolituus maritimus TaxID=484498 RepID=A0ABQ0A1D1_9GAMM
MARDIPGTPTGTPPGTLPSVYGSMSQVIAHRGASGSAPENTAIAMTEAVKQGADWAEVDVTISADGHAVIFHDNNLNRCSDGNGLVIQKTLKELEKLDAGSWFSPFCAGEKILSLEALLRLADQLDLNLNLEIKPTIGREAETVWAIQQTLARASFGPSILLSSFNYFALKEAQSLLPHYTRALNVEAIPSDWQDRLDSVGAEGLHFASDFIDYNMIEEVVNAGTPLACYTVNDFETAQKLLRAGVSAVFTDYPDRLLLDARPVSQH